MEPDARRPAGADLAGAHRGALVGGPRVLRAVSVERAQGVRMPNIWVAKRVWNAAHDGEYCWILGCLPKSTSSKVLVALRSVIRPWSYFQTIRTSTCPSGFGPPPVQVPSSVAPSS